MTDAELVAAYSREWRTVQRLSDEYPQGKIDQPKLTHLSRKTDACHRLLLEIRRRGLESRIK